MKTKPAGEWHRREERKAEIHMQGEARQKNPHTSWEPNWKQTWVRAGEATFADRGWCPFRRKSEVVWASQKQRKKNLWWKQTKLFKFSIWLKFFEPLESDYTPWQATNPHPATPPPHPQESPLSCACMCGVVLSIWWKWEKWLHWITMELKCVIFITELGRLSLCGLCNIPLSDFLL